MPKTATTLPIETIDANPDDEPLVCIAINRDWLKIITGALRPLLYHNYWGGTLEQNRTARQQAQTLIAMFIPEGGCDDFMANINCCCNPEVNVQVQINPDWTINVSSDGGQTFTPSITDPREGIPALPPPPTASNKCNLAEGYIIAFQEWVGKVHTLLGGTDTLSQFLIDAIVALLEIVLVFVAGTTIGTAITGVAALFLKQWYGTPQADWDALWTPEVYHAIRCIIFCNLPDSGQFDQNTYNTALAQFLGGTIPGGQDVKGAALNAQASFKFWGLKGVNTILANGHALSDDCGDCGCGCDLSTWVAVVVGGVPIGTILDVGADFITVQSVERVGGPLGHFHQILIQSGNAIDCCTWLNNDEIISGGLGGFQTCWLCGSAYPGAGEIFNPIGQQTVTTIGWEFDDDIQRVLKIKFST